MSDVSYKPLIQDMVWSYSRIKSFSDCPYKWFLRYIKKYPAKPLFFSSYGSFVHELIADYLSGKKTRSEVSSEYLEDFSDRVKPRAPNQTIFKNYFRDGINYFRHITRPPNKVAAVEEKVAFEIEGFPFTGYIDIREETKAGDIVITDNKSRNLKPRSTRSTPTKTDLELDDYLRQLYLYSYAVHENCGKFPSALCFNCFRTNTRIEEPFSKERYENAVVWAKESIERITEEEEFAPDLEFFRCKHLCEMQDHCEYFKLMGW